MDLSEYYARLSEEVKFLLVVAGYEAEARFAISIGSEHLLLAMVSNKYARVSKLLNSAGVTKENLEKNIDNSEAEFIPNLSPEKDLNEEACRVIERALVIAWSWSHRISSVHVLKACLEEESSISSHLLNTLCDEKTALERRIENTLKLMVPSENAEHFDVPINFQANKDRKAKRINPPSELKIRTKDKQELTYKLLSKTESAETREVEDKSHKNATPSRTRSWLSESANEVIAQASSIAKELGFTLITDANLFNAIIKRKDLASVIELNSRVDSAKLCKYLYSAPHWSTSDAVEPLNEHGEKKLFSANASKTLNDARELMGSINHKTISPDIILISILKKFKSELVENDGKKYSPSLLANDLLEKLTSPASEYDKEVVFKSQGNIPAKILVSVRVAKVFQEAAHEAAERNHLRIETIHILLALIKIAMETEIEFVLSREQDFLKLKSAFIELADELEMRIATDDSKEELVLKPEVSEEVFELLLLANEESSEKNFSVIDLNHIAIATLKRLPDEAELLILANQLSPIALIKRLDMCNAWQKHQKTLSPQAILIHLDKLDFYFNEDILSSKHYNKTVVLDVLSFSAKRLIEVAVAHLKRERRPVCVEDLFYGITSVSCKASEALQNVGITNDRGELETELPTGKGSIRCLPGQKFSYNAEKILEKSWEIAKDYNLVSVEPEHILLAIIEEHDGLAYTVVHGLDIDPGELKKELLQLIA